MKKYYLVAGAFLLGASLQAQTFSDDFESYTAGSYLGASSPNWTTWSGTTGGAEDVQISTAQAASGSNSIYFASTAASGGPQDVVLPFGGAYSSGTFVFEANFYVNSGKSGYFNFQKTQVIGTEWTLDVYMNANGSLSVENSGVVMATGTYPQGQWFNLKFDIDLTTNNWNVLVDNVSQGIFTNVDNQLASIDIFPLNGDQFYVDDVAYTYTPFTPSNFDLAALQISFDGGLATQQRAVTASVKNLGNTTITSYDIMLDYNGNQQTENVTGVNIVTLGTHDVVFTTPVTLAAGTNNMVITISNINGNTSDDIAANDTKSIVVDPVVPAANKMVVGEEGTGTWCQWCPRGAVVMEEMANKYHGFWAGVAVHNGDPMTNTVYDAGIDALIAGYPSGVVDRYPEVDPLQFEQEFLARITTAPKAVLEAGATWNSTTRELKVSVATDWVTNSTGNYKLAVVLTEDGVTGTGAGWSQSNAYAGGGNGVMGGYELLPNPVPASQMVYDHVARLISPSFAGQSGAFPTPQNAGTSYVHNFTFTLNSAWDDSQMHIVAMILMPNGRVENATTATIAEAVSNGFQSGIDITGVEDLSIEGAKINMYPNPTANLTNVAIELEKTSEVSLSIFNINGQQVASRDYGQLSGAVQLPVETSSLSNGLYLVQVTINGERTTLRLSVEK